ncbi:FHF complex subunit HOOK-interacting protein 1B isoform X1 [Mobula birostris]|uniref:FHF complex subunit HOOK-interacting protein 1B isoform X1 n=1 Tax=Mobula birostris TaxID=1983395 RepID=UPI003B27D3EB
MSWLSRLNPRSSGNRATPSTRQQSPVTADPETCFMVFRNHWVQVSRILEQRDPRMADEVSAVRNHTDQMVYLLAEERAPEGRGMGPILELVILEDVLDQLLCWTLRRQPDDTGKMEQLKLFDLLVSQSQQPLLRHKPILNALTRLLGACTEPHSPSLENSLVLLLNQVCVSLSKEPSVLELFVHTEASQRPANLLIFSILVPFIHREGLIGQQARDALLLIMGMSAGSSTVGSYIANNSYFCPVLATGLSALYSSLPRKIEVRGDDWHALRREDWVGVPSIAMFMNSLEFCNAVIQVAHPLVRNQLVEYVHNGFLVPVMGPALHKSSIEEMIASTAYLDLFLRSITEVALLKTFLRFIVLHRHEGSTILDTLTGRINSNSRLCMVSLSLFRTLLTLSCEDVMLQLILRYLIPCNHVMLSQRCAVKDQDFYGKTADKFLSLIPECCKPENLGFFEREEEHAVWSKAHGSPSIDTSTVMTAVPKPSTPSRISLFSRQQSTGSDGGIPPRSPGEAPSDPTTCSPSHGRWDEVSELDSNYLEYLQDARRHIDLCVKACGRWSAPYDGQEPDPLSAQPLPEDVDTIRLHMDHFGADRTRTSSVPGQGQLRSDPFGRREPLENGDWVSTTPRSKKRSLRRERVKAAPPKGRGLRPDRDQLGRVHAEGRVSLLNGGSSSGPGLPGRADNCLAVKKVRRDRPQRSHPRREVTGSRSGVPCEPHISLAEGGEEEGRAGSRPGLDTLAGGKSLDSLIDELLDQAPAEANGRGLNVEKFSQELLEMEAEMGGWHRMEEKVASGGDPLTEEEAEDEDGEEEEDEDDSYQLVPGSRTLARVQAQVPVSSHLPEPAQDLPSTGSFIAVLFAKLENMLQNSLYVNFLLTGIIAQLACYPQPLLRSFLLNTNMVFQPSVKSLIQVLGSVKNKIEVFAASQEDFPMMLYKARKYLIARGKLDWSDSPNSVPPLRRSDSLAVKSRKPSLGELILRHTNSPTRARQAAQLALQHVREGQVLHTLTGSSIFKSSAEKQNEALRVKNAVYCSLIFSEFLKELAAIAQEHAVTSPFLLEDREE